MTTPAEMRETAARVAETRHAIWREHPTEHDVSCDVTACADIAAAIRALPLPEPPRKLVQPAITRTDDTLGGSWRIAGTRISTRVIYEAHADGWDSEHILAEWHGITAEDVRLAIEFEQERAKAEAGPALRWDDGEEITTLMLGAVPLAAIQPHPNDKFGAYSTCLFGPHTWHGYEFNTLNAAKSALEAAAREALGMPAEAGARCAAILLAEEEEARNAG